MSEFDPTQVDWGRVYAEALEIALGFSPRGAQDLVQLGMTLVLEGTAPFDEASGKTLAEHLVEVALTAERNRARSERRRQNPKQTSKLQHWLDVEPPTPEELNDERALGDAAHAALLAECADDPDVRALVDLARDDVDEAAEQQVELGWDIERVRNARKRMNRMLGHVADAMKSWKEKGEP